MTTITVEHISKSFALNEEGRAIKVLDDVSFKVRSGEVLVLLGPSGCGKTTLLRIIAGLESPDSGRVLYNQLPISAVPRMDRGIGMVFQNWALIPHWEVRSSIGFFLRLRKREQEVPERVARVAQITGVGLDHLMDRRPSQLSGGEKQRVAIARAFARDLKILLLDEPFANLDARLRTAARVELKRLLSTYPITTVYVTHDLGEASSLGTRIALMREGRLEQFGSYQQLYESPLNLFIADFIGVHGINLFAGHVEEGHWRGESFGPYPIRSDLSPGASVTLGIRPEAVYLKSDGVPAVVESVTPFYAERAQLVEVWLGRERWSLLLPPEEHIRVGSTIYCELDHPRALYFDSRTGRRIG